MGKVGSRSCKRSLWDAGIKAEHCHILAHGVGDKYYIPKLDTSFVVDDDTFIITLVRESVSRNLSRFFHDLNVDPSKRNIHQIGLAHAIKFEQTYDHYQGSRWFENNFEPSMKVNPLEIQFDKEAGYTFLTDRIVIVRLENLNNVFPLLTKKALGVSVPIHRYGSTQKKFYNETKQHISKSYINKMNTSPIMMHFYTEEERNKFKEGWYRKTLTKD